MPLIYESRHGSVVPELFSSHETAKECHRGGMLVTPAGKIILSNVTNAGSYYLTTSGIRRFLIFQDNGTCPRDSIFGPVLHPGNAEGEVYAAVSPDENTLYATGHFTGSASSPAYYHAVYKSPVEFGGQMSVFIGTPGTPGSDNYHFNLPKGLATDASGRIYVADQGNNRVMIYDASGNYLNRFAVRSPDKIQIHPVNGQIYVSSLGNNLFAINKYSAYPALDSLYAFVNSWDNIFEPQICLNPHVTPNKIYFNNAARLDERVYVLEDNGTRILRTSLVLNQGKPDLLSRDAGYDAHESPGRIAVDTAESMIMAGFNDKWVKVDIGTGAIKPSAISCKDLVFGRDGYAYAYGPRSGYIDSLMFRYQVDWDNESRVNFANNVSEFTTVNNRFPGPNTLSGGLYVKKNGEMVITSYCDEDFKTCVYNPDGTLKKDSLILANGRVGLGGINIDRNGNLFTMIHARPKALKYPEMDIFTGKYFPDPWVSGQLWDFNYYFNHYAWNYGSVFKLPQQGGRFIKESVAPLSSLPDEDLSHDTIPTTQMNGFFKYFQWRVTGPVKQYFGISPSASVPGGHDRCLCINGRMGLDGFGRLFAPDIFRFQVVMLDNNLNEIGRFGEYGNADVGPGTAYPEPAIPLGFPQFITAINDHVYISDLGNHRITRIKLTYNRLFDGDTVIGVNAGEMAAATADVRISVYPTPFVSSACLDVRLPKQEKLKIDIYDLGGRRVRTLASGKYAAGTHKFLWQGRSSQTGRLASGLYFARITVDHKVYVKDLVMIK
jgi:DNA-binding beta-propeller fold protein YncE